MHTQHELAWCLQLAPRLLLFPSPVPLQQLAAARARAHAHEAHSQGAERGSSRAIHTHVFKHARTHTHTHTRTHARSGLRAARARGALCYRQRRRGGPAARPLRPRGHPLRHPAGCTRDQNMPVSASPILHTSVLWRRLQIRRRLPPAAHARSRACARAGSAGGSSRRTSPGAPDSSSAISFSNSANSASISPMLPPGRLRQPCWSSRFPLPHPTPPPLLKCHELAQEFVLANPARPSLRR